MKIVVLGSSGMLGRYVTSYFQQEANEKQVNYDVIPLSRKDGLDVTTMTSGELFGFLGNALPDLKAEDAIINCIGLIKQRKTDDLDFFKVNSLFPWFLSEFAASFGCNVIHPSTDCVFSGEEGDYDEFFPPNPTDVYGMSKALADMQPLTIIRSSIIGEELDNKLSFIEWAKSEKGKKVKGFTNHTWNGITCLQYAKIAQQIIDEGIFWTGVRHLSSTEVYSKYTMLTFVDEIFELNLTIDKHSTGKANDRTLSSMHESGFDIPDLRTQIKELKEFNLNYAPPIPKAVDEKDIVKEV